MAAIGEGVMGGVEMVEVASEGGKFPHALPESYFQLPMPSIRLKDRITAGTHLHKSYIKCSNSMRGNFS